MAHMQQQDGGAAAAGKPQTEALHQKASRAMAAREDEELRQIQEEHDQVKPSSVDDFRSALHACRPLPGATDVRPTRRGQSVARPGSLGVRQQS